MSHCLDLRATNLLQGNLFETLFIHMVACKGSRPYTNAVTHHLKEVHVAKQTAAEVWVNALHGRNRPGMHYSVSYDSPLRIGLPKHVRVDEQILLEVSFVLEKSANQVPTRDEARN